jgi:hypothetical protein
VIEEKEKERTFPPADIIDIPQNRVDGNCDNLYNHARQIGVYNELDGTYHKNNDNENPQVGVTAYRISFTSNEIVSEKIERNVIKYKCINNEVCPHSNQIYDSRSQCEVECPSGGLGCFRGRCDGMTCKVFISSNKIKLVFKSETKTYGLKWEPTLDISQECKNSIEKYAKDLAIHEGKHIQDLKDILKLVNDRQPDKQYYGCGNNEEKAMEDIQKQITDMGEKIIKDLQKDYEDNYYPNVEQDFKINLDCRPCNINP